MGTAPVYESMFGAGVPGFFPNNPTPIIGANKVKFLVAGTIYALRCWFDTSQAGNVTGYLRKIGPGTVERAVAFKRHLVAGVDPSAWQVAYISPSLHVNANDIYHIGMIYSNGLWSDWNTAHAPDTDITLGHFVLMADPAASPFSGRYSTNITYNPNTANGNMKFAHDFHFVPD